MLLQNFNLRLSSSVLGPVTAMLYRISLKFTVARCAFCCVAYHGVVQLVVTYLGMPMDYDEHTV